MKNSTAFLIRLAACAVLTIVLWWVGVRYGGVSFNASDMAGAIVGLAWACFIGLVWAAILGWPLILSVAGKFTGLWFPSDDNFRVRPEYSIAEARVHQGLYKEAIAAFRLDIQNFPNEATPHVRIAELQLERFNDVPAAIAELKAALTKCRDADSFSLVSSRLADLYFHRSKDRAAAIECLREIARRYPDSKQALTSREKAQRLSDRSPTNIATDS